MSGLKPFTLDDFCFSATAVRLGIDNSIPDYLLPNARHSLDTLNALQEYLGRSIRLTSGYRCLDLNNAIGSKPSSAHINALAFDFTCRDIGEPKKVALLTFNFFTSGGKQLTFDQIIYEFDAWVHVGLSSLARRQLLTINRRGIFNGIG